MIGGERLNINAASVWSPACVITLDSGLHVTSHNSSDSVRIFHKCGKSSLLDLRTLTTLIVCSAFVQPDKVI